MSLEFLKLQKVIKKKLICSNMSGKKICNKGAFWKIFSLTPTPNVYTKTASESTTFCSNQWKNSKGRKQPRFLGVCNVILWPSFSLFHLFIYWFDVFEFLIFINLFTCNNKSDENTSMNESWVYLSSIYQTRPFPYVTRLNQHSCHKGNKV